MTDPETRTDRRRKDARTRLLDAAVDMVRQRGFGATRVDDLCAAAGVTKGAFFHHFKTKEEMGVAVIAHWVETTDRLFAAAPHHRRADPLDRVLGYLDMRKQIGQGEIADFSCVAGTTVQEIHASSPLIRSAAEDAVRAGAAHVEHNLELALAAQPVAGVTAGSLALYVQTILQGSIVVAKALADDRPVTDAIEHLQRYLRQLFDRPAAA
ncbi:TetR/AcrR family transcriptional regulator [Frigidibacter oleivorans]|uniref:TetR/AcrR family transcriptional regulator n=1 Tax=Frigidibacter oleivorans TaxID=2487129 RepID=UPI000F8ED280|nr:TetR/AcrR family transcriptional regulator [Frigidibacter oleivorans]